VWACRLTGCAENTQDLGASIQLYNRSRAKLRQAYLNHRLQPSLWTAERIGLLTESSMRVLRQDHLGWMDALPWEAGSPDSEKRIPVYVKGKIWDPPGILDLMDRLGMVLAGDEIVTGFRSVEIDAGPDDDPFGALVERHFATMPYAGYHIDPGETVASFVKRVRSSGAQGVIFLNPKFCEAAGFDVPDFSKALAEAEIPTLILETSARGSSLDQVRLRMEAFQEMIAGDLP